MTIRHVDRAGNPWTFEIDCTPVQGRMFERLLLTVRNIGNREELNLDFLLDAGNTAFRDDMEHAVLSALKTWTENTNTATAPPTPAALRGTDEQDGDDEREPYYWESF